MKQVKPYLLVGEPVLAQVREKLLDILHPWGVDWGLEEFCSNLTCVRAWEAGIESLAGSCTHGYEREEKSVWLSWNKSLVSFVESQMFPVLESHGGQVEHTTRISCEAAELAVWMVANLLVRAGGLSDSSMVGEEEGYRNFLTVGSGAVMIDIRFGDHSLHAIFSYDSVCTLIGKSRLQRNSTLPAISILDAVSCVSVPVRVEAGRAEVSIKNLKELKVGDVICLDTIVDAPFSVTGNDGERLFGGYLGLVENRKAIEIVR